MKEFKFKVATRKTGKVVKYGKIKAGNREEAYRKVEYNMQPNPRQIDTYYNRFMISIQDPDGKYRFV